MPNYRIFVTPWGTAQNSNYTAFYPPKWGWRLDGQGAAIAPVATELNVTEATMTWGLNQAGVFRAKTLKRVFSQAIVSSATTQTSFREFEVRSTAGGSRLEGGDHLRGYTLTTGSTSSGGVSRYSYQLMEPGRFALWVQRDDQIIWGGIIWDVSGDTGSDAIEIVAEEFPSYWQKLRWDWLWNPQVGPPAYNPDLVGVSDRNFGYFYLSRAFNNFVAQQPGGVALNFTHLVRQDLGIPYDGEKYYMQTQPTDYRVLMDMVRDLQSVGADLGTGHGFEWTCRYLGYSTATPKYDVAVVYNDGTTSNNPMDSFGAGAYWTFWSPFAGVTRNFPQIGWGNVSNANTLSVKWTYSARNMASRYRVVGYGDRAAGWVTSVASSFNDTYPAAVSWPRFDDLYSNQWLRTSEATSAASLRNIVYRVRPQMTLHARVRPNNQFPFGSVGVGDTILCNLDDAYIQFTGYFRVTELQLDVSGQDETYELTLIPPSGLSGAQAPLVPGAVAPVINTNTPNRIAILGDDVMLGTGCANPTTDAWWQQARLNLNQGASAIWDTSRCAGANSFYAQSPSAPQIFCLNKAGGGPFLAQQLVQAGVTNVIICVGLYDILYWGNLAAQGFGFNTSAIVSGMMTVLASYTNAFSTTYVAGSTTRPLKWWVASIIPLPLNHPAYGVLSEQIRVPFNSQIASTYPNNYLDFATAVQNSPTVWQYRNSSYVIQTTDYHLNSAGHAQLYNVAAAAQVWN